jgi:hypothetical protein
MVDYSINRWNKEHPCAAVIDMQFCFTESTHATFHYWSAAYLTERWSYKGEVVKTIGTQEPRFDFFLTYETILWKDKV